MRKFCLTTFFLTGILISKVHSQTAQDFYQLMQKYFLVLPYEKQVVDWAKELTENKKVVVRPAHKDDSTNQIFYRGYITNWPVFEKLDSVIYYIGSRGNSGTFRINGKIIKSFDNRSTYFDEIFYFPLQAFSKKEWKTTYKKVLSDFGKICIPDKNYIPGSQGERVWFISPFGEIIERVASVEYGKIEKRQLYFLRLTLYFASYSGE